MLPSAISLRRAGAGVAWSAASVAFVTLLLSLTRIPEVPLYVAVSVLGFAVFVACRPGDGLWLLAGAIPVASWLGRRWHPELAWPETLAVAFLAGYCGRAALSRSRTADPATLPVLLLGVLVLSSMAVHLAVIEWQVGAAQVRASLYDIVTRDFFLLRVSDDVIDAGMRLIESLLLFRAAANLTQTLPGIAVRVVCAFAAGTAVAGTLNVLRLWQAARSAESPVAALAAYLSSVRINLHYPDLNAAGSQFALGLLVTTGLAWGTRRRLLWVPLALLTASALWVAGSRAALVSAIVVATLTGMRFLPRMSGRTTRRGALVGAGLLVVFLLATAAVYMSPHDNQAPAGTALRIRWGFLQTSVRMAAAHPAFGVGVGQYHARSGEFSSAELLQLFPPAQHENAHNNFLQILSELGIVGFAVFTWLLGAAAVSGAGLLRADPGDPLPLWLGGGLAAFALTCLGGHPLLTDVPAFSFWILLGVMTGWGVSATGGLRPRPVGWFVAVLVLAVVATVPARIRQGTADAILEHVGIGVSEWQASLDGLRYRLAGRVSTVFVPASARAVTIPLRSTGHIQELEVGLELDNRPANVVRVPVDRWLMLRLPLPSSPNRARSRRLDLHVKDAPSTLNPLIMIGKIDPR